jgi:hypothetical protein
MSGYERHLRDQRDRLIWIPRIQSVDEVTVVVPGNTPTEVWVPTTGGSVTAPEGATFVRNDTAGMRHTPSTRWVPAPST